MTIDKLQSLDVEYNQVVFIDCLPQDEYNDWQISQSLMHFLANNGIMQSAFICRNRNVVVKTLEHLIKLATNGEKFPLHIVSHGDSSGLWLKSNDEDVFWTDLTHLFERLNAAMHGKLIVNMTSCLGLTGIRIVDEMSDKLPFFGLIGYSEDLEVQRGIEINELFYDKLLKGKSIQITLKEMRTELNDDNVYCISSEGFKSIVNKLGKQ